MVYKKVTIISIMSILLLLSISLWGEMVVWADSNAYTKVGLKYGSSAVTICNIKSDGGFILGTASDTGFTALQPLPFNKLIIATLDQGKVVLKDESGLVLSADLGTSGCIMPANYDSGGVIYFEETPYRGGILLLPTSDNKMKVINFLSIEHYVYGVLHSEMGQASPIEALKAQAVAARSYAVANAKNHANDGFNMCSTTHCQVYKGYSAEYPSTNKAVDDTAGKVIYSQGKPVTAFYSKNSGGYTQNSEDVWSQPCDYLKAVKDIYSPDYPWTAIVSFDEIQTKLENAGQNPGKIQSVAIKAKTASGSVLEMEFIGSNQTVTLKKDAVRTTLGASLVKSLMFSMIEAGSWSTDNNELKNVTISNGTTTVLAGTEISVIDGSGTISKKSLADLYGSNGSNVIKMKGTGQTLEIVKQSPLTLSGKGYGHGIGMAQDGAIAMAKQGFTYEDILKFYYTGIEIK